MRYCRGGPEYNRELWRKCECAKVCSTHKKLYNTQTQYKNKQKLAFDEEKVKFVELLKLTTLIKLHFFLSFFL